MKLGDTDTVGTLKRRIEEHTEVQPKRQKLLGLKAKKGGGTPADELPMADLALKPGLKIMMMGCGCIGRSRDSAYLHCDSWIRPAVAGLPCQPSYSYPGPMIDAAELEGLKLRGKQTYTLSCHRESTSVALSVSNSANIFRARCRTRHCAQAAYQTSCFLIRSRSYAILATIWSLLRHVNNRPRSLSP